MTVQIAPSKSALLWPSRPLVSLEGLETQQSMFEEVAFAASNLGEAA
jgi:hypothetical protein